MQHLTLSRQDFNELFQLAEFLVSSHPEKSKAVLKTQKFEGDIQKLFQGKPLYIYAALLGYTSRTIYNKRNQGRIQEDKLLVFIKIFDDFKSKKSNANTIDTKWLKVAQTLLGRIRHAQEKYKESFNPDTQQSPLFLYKNSKWFIYERFLDTIGRKTLEFLDQYDENSLKIIIKTAEEDSKAWEGKAFFNSKKDYLIFHPTNSGETRQAHYIIKVSDENKMVELCMGHLTFPNRTHHRNVVTKSIVLHHVDDKEFEDGPKEFLFHEGATTNSIPTAISRYLRNRTLNRLSSPHSKMITSLKLLETWHQENDNVKRNDRNQNILGTYLVKYKGSFDDARLSTDKLIIKENEDCDLIATYEHEVQAGKPQLWEGSVHYSSATRVVSIAVKGPKHRGDVSRIYLMLNIPAGEREFDVITGNIMGIRDEYDGSIGLMVVVFRELQNITEDEIQNNTMIITKFFESYVFQSRILPPPLPVATFKELDKSCDWALEIKTLVLNQMKS